MKYTAFLLLFASLLSHAQESAQATGQPVTAFNFARAETDLYFSRMYARGGLNRIVHQRTPTGLDEQTVIRMNRDTLYSSSLHDLSAGPVTATLAPQKNGRFQSLQVISQDHYTHTVIYEGSVTLTEEDVGTRYALVLVRTFADADDPADIALANQVQDGVRIEQQGKGRFDVPNWDSESRDAARSALHALTALGGADEKIRMGRADEVDPWAHLMATAGGWGLNPRADAMYYIRYPEHNDGTQAYEMVLKDVPVDGFWSVTVYNAKGYLQENAQGAYSFNQATAETRDDGSVRLQFGDCEDASGNCLPIMEGWNYTFRLYRPRAEVLDGSWQAPEPVVLKP